jgi:hypothetical protein
MGGHGRLRMLALGDLLPRRRIEIVAIGITRRDRLV